MDENRENDVLMMELPEYEEEFSPFAEVETQEISFVVNKEEIYKRNRLIAAEEKMKQLDEAEKVKEDKRTEMENIYTEASQNRTIGITKKSFLIIVAASVLSLLLLVMAANIITTPEAEIAEETAAFEEIVFTFATDADGKVIIGEKSVTEEAAEKEAYAEDAVTEEASEEKKPSIPPLEADNGQTVYTDDNISIMADIDGIRPVRYYPAYKNDPYINENYYVLFVNFTVKNLTDSTNWFTPDRMCIKLSRGRISPGYRTIQGSFVKKSDTNFIASGEQTEVLSEYIISAEEMGGIAGFEYVNELVEALSPDFPDFEYEDEAFSTSAAEKLEFMESDECKTTVVREPLEETDGTTVYNTDTISYRFAVHYEENEYGATMMTIDVTAKNMTDYGYLILPGNFYLSANGDRDYYFEESNYNEALTYFTSRSRTDDEEEWREGNPIAFAFDEDNLCSFTLTGYISEEGGFDSFGFESDKGWSSNYEPVESFEIPLDTMTAP
ncbi:MAG: hypothetical protein IKK42_00860 [Oscillospiraceae bacterium]|nr:hypothetical protein [Oscillospiraceae bacterium]